MWCLRSCKTVFPCALGTNPSEAAPWVSHTHGGHACRGWLIGRGLAGAGRIGDSNVRGDCYQNTFGGKKMTQKPIILCNWYMPINISKVLFYNLFGQLQGIFSRFIFFKKITSIQNNKCACKHAQQYQNKNEFKENFKSLVFHVSSSTIFPRS